MFNQQALAKWYPWAWLCGQHWGPRSCLCPHAGHSWGENLHKYLLIKWDKCYMRKNTVIWLHIMENLIIFSNSDSASLVAQMVKNLSALRETCVQSASWEEPLEEGMATHSSTLAWRTPRTEETGGLLSMGSQRVGHGWEAKRSTVVQSKAFL